MVLISCEDACTRRSNLDIAGRMGQVERLVQLFQHMLSIRQNINNALVRTICTYHAKVQELLWYV